MFEIRLSPVRSESTLSVSVSGDVLIINGTSFDFSPLPEGGSLPAAAIDCADIVGPVTRNGSVIKVTLRFPHGPAPQQHVAFPEPITVAEGVVVLPANIESEDFNLLGALADD